MEIGKHYSLKDLSDDVRHARKTSKNRKEKLSLPKTKAEKGKCPHESKMHGDEVDEYLSLLNSEGEVYWEDLRLFIGIRDEDVESAKKYSDTYEKNYAKVYGEPKSKSKPRKKKEDNDEDGKGKKCTA